MPWDIFGPHGPEGPQGTPGLNWDNAGWVTATAYVIDDALEHGGASYRCYVDHTSGASTEPGIGADWATKWKVVAAEGEAGDLAGTIFDAKGDLITATAADTPSILPVGANDTVLIADSAEAKGVRWGAVAGGPTFIRKAADQSKTSDTSFSDVTDIAIPVAASDVVWFQLLLLVTGGTTGDMFIEWTGPASCAMWQGGSGGSGIASWDSSFTSSSPNTLASLGTTGQFGLAAVTSGIWIAGIIINGANAGTVQLRFRQIVSNATPSTIKQNSVLMYKKIT